MHASKIIIAVARIRLEKIDVWWKGSHIWIKKFLVWQWDLFDHLWSIVSPHLYAADCFSIPKVDYVKWKRRRNNESRNVLVIIVWKIGWLWGEDLDSSK